ncbi:capsule assembly Wzi family protein [Emticicia sp. BO119]|uniref:capsule assembly Wzi family protein n=1 Tax=Emticicia sp. BO119 TaxID=2757768 RepID=UPI0015F092C8|nr:capsule assembly Wzi family protein [Emticicia sp. BO119]MBA4853948.1 hypothetical protein [Emticicia sp. BO119]
MHLVYKIILLFFLTKFCALGQSFFKKINYELESGIYLSTSGKTPFLIHANQYGIVPLETPFIALKGAAVKEYDSTYTSNNKLNRFSYGYGVNTILNVGKANQILLPEAYFKIRYGVFEFYVGRRKELVGLVDTTLSSGSYIWSGNALPLPKIQLSIPNYTPILGNGLISIKGAFSHGLFDNGKVRNFYLHQKYLYARLGKPNWKIKLYSGFSHQVQWGGQPVTPFIDNLTGDLISRFPSDFNTYLKVVTGVSLNKNGEGLNTGSPKNEAWNRAGNHLGSIDLATEFNLRNFDILFYRQSIYDDGSLFYLNNIQDGLLGISIKRKNAFKGIIRINFEYLNTMNQGGRPEDRNDDIPQLRGGDNYFNNSIYPDSWTYRNNTIGTPLLSPINFVDKNVLANRNLEKYSSSYILNRVESYSFGIEGKGKNVEYCSKIVLIHNLGSYFLPINDRATTFLCKFKYNLLKFSIITNIAVNEGKLFPYTLGGYLAIQRTFF